MTPFPTCGQSWYATRVVCRRRNPVACMVLLQQGTTWLGQSPTKRPAMGQVGQWSYLLVWRVRQGSPALLLTGMGLRRSTGHSMQGGASRLKPDLPASWVFRQGELSSKQAARPGGACLGLLCHAADMTIKLRYLHKVCFQASGPPHTWLR